MAKSKLAQILERWSSNLRKLPPRWYEADLGHGLTLSVGPYRDEGLTLCAIREAALPDFKGEPNSKEAKAFIREAETVERFAAGAGFALSHRRVFVRPGLMNPRYSIHWTVDKVGEPPTTGELL